MKKLRIILVVLLSLAVIISLIFLGIRIFIPRSASLVIETKPASLVFIDGAQVGRTSYNEILRPKEITIKLVPESFSDPLTPYETKVTLVSGVETVITRDFGRVEDLSQGEIVSYEKIPKNDVGLAVVTNPDSAQITIDGQLRGITPYVTSSISPQTHTILISANGYLERKFSVKIRQGFKLTASVKLAVDLNKTNETPKENNDAGDEKVAAEVKVEILDTPTGFLRVRDSASTTGQEIGRVSPKEQYKVIEENKENGWYKIEYVPASGGSDAKQGWISSEYARKIEITVTPTP